MMNVYLEYWRECVTGCFEEHGITATQEQIERIAADIEVSAANMSLVFGPPPGPSLARIEADDLKRKLSTEKDKVYCGDCRPSYVRCLFSDSIAKCAECGMHVKRQNR